MVGLNILGTYRLIRRELPDGTVQLPPSVKGMFTYRKDSEILTWYGKMTTASFTRSAMWLDTH